MKKWKKLLRRLTKYFSPTADKKPRRICRACQKPIRKRHKYRFDGSSVEHRDCQNPTLEQMESAQQELIP